MSHPLMKLIEFVFPHDNENKRHLIIGHFKLFSFHIPGCYLILSTKCCLTSTGIKGHIITSLM